MARFHYSKAFSQYGASMGRRNSPGKLFGKVRLQKVPLCPGGYDPGGAYWGHGEPLWRAEDSDGNEVYLRAETREAAKLALQSGHAEEPGGLRFYR